MNYEKFSAVAPYEGEYSGRVEASVRASDAAVNLSIGNQIFTRQDIKELRAYLKAILRDTKA